MRDSLTFEPVPEDGVALPLEEGIGFRLGRLHRVGRASWALELQELGTVPLEVAVVRAVAGSPDASIRGVARTIGTDAMAVKRAVDALEARGLVLSSALVGDRRPRALRVTPAGSELVSEVDRRIRRRERLYDSLGPTVRAGLVQAIDELERTLGIGSDGSHDEKESLEAQ